MVRWAWSVVSVWLCGCGSDPGELDARRAMALDDVLASVRGFAKVTTDVAGATLFDLAAVHATLPYRDLLGDEAPPVRRTIRLEQPIANCAGRDGSTTRWACAMSIGESVCDAVGTGTVGSDGSLSGASELRCRGFPRVVVTVTGLRYDERAGFGTGTLTVDGWATLRVDGLGFCAVGTTMRPRSGRATVDGTGSLEGLPLDPLALRFTGCGSAEIE